MLLNYFCESLQLRSLGSWPIRIMTASVTFMTAAGGREKALISLISHFLRQSSYWCRMATSELIVVRYFWTSTFDFLALFLGELFFWWCWGAALLRWYMESAIVVTVSSLYKLEERATRVGFFYGVLDIHLRICQMLLDFDKGFSCQARSVPVSQRSNELIWVFSKNQKVWPCYLRCILTENE